MKTESLLKLLNPNIPATLAENFSVLFSIDLLSMNTVGSLCFPIFEEIIFDKTTFCKLAVYLSKGI